MNNFEFPRVNHTAAICWRALQYGSFACEPKLWGLVHAQCLVYESFHVSHNLFLLLYISQILRRIFVPDRDSGFWKIRVNGYIYIYIYIYIYTYINIYQHMKILRWAIHIIRMEEGRIPRKALDVLLVKKNRQTSGTMWRDGQEGCKNTFWTQELEKDGKA